jgi:hypothetical protein
LRRGKAIEAAKIRSGVAREMKASMSAFDTSRWRRLCFSAKSHG